MANKKETKASKVEAEVKSEGPVAVDINNPAHGNLTFEELQGGK